MADGLVRPPVNANDLAFGYTVAGYVPEELRFDEVTTALCPHCGAVQVFSSFTVIDAFICSECGQGMGVERPIQ